MKSPSNVPASRNSRSVAKGIETWRILPAPNQKFNFSFLSLKIKIETWRILPALNQKFNFSFYLSKLKSELDGFFPYELKVD
ncbi:hypothetical protein MmiHf6_05970 [Methanimicrococcus hongohii]|uniref:Uncharacterized protein n=1 Tax=Methanimicrococcus hongohii TaxID=3028295 RepID=A0AA96UZ11_9EURY|nr:hypothetical protein MmiHf6_05970 [Methanimicrococcus sp. Hf6]